MKKKSFYIPALDGIRALAFLLVYVGHTPLGSVVPGGLGVTTFFFLSGFLITTLLRQEFEKSGTIDLKMFYLRRSLRIFPPLYITLVIMVVATYANLFHSATPLDAAAVPTDYRFMYRETPLDVPAVASEFLFMTNYYSIFGPTPHGWPPGSEVLWSLAVEEHFYLLFPALAIVLLRSVSVRGRIGLLSALCLLSLVWRCVLVYAWDVPEARTYKATDTRLDSILFGCLMALGFNPCFHPPKSIRATTRWSILIGSVALLVFSLMFRDPRFRESFRYTVQGVGLLGLFYFAIYDHERFYFRWLNWGWLRFIGVLSYSLYLIHFSSQIMIDIHMPHASMLAKSALALVFNFAFALGMYYTVERPLARLRQRLHGRGPVPAVPQLLTSEVSNAEVLG